MAQTPRAGDGKKEMAGSDVWSQIEMPGLETKELVSLWCRAVASSGALTPERTPQLSLASGDNNNNCNNNYRKQQQTCSCENFHKQWEPKLIITGSKNKIVLSHHSYKVDSSRTVFLSLICKKYSDYYFGILGPKVPWIIVNSWPAVAVSQTITETSTGQYYLFWNYIASLNQIVT